MALKINLDDLKKKYESYDTKREKVIKQSREVLKSSKQLIYSIHRENKSESKKLKIQLEKDFSVLKKITDDENKLNYEGSFNEALEEFGEAMLYYDYCYESNLRNFEELNISHENYLGALSDLTGELARKAVQLTIKKKYDEVFEIHEFVSLVFKELMKICFRNGNLRKKFDSIKWNLNKIEDIIYDIEMQKKSERNI